eukprot:59087-Pyramimonas_sp.AAC.1
MSSRMVPRRTSRLPPKTRKGTRAAPKIRDNTISQDASMNLEDAPKTPQEAAKNPPEDIMATLRGGRRIQVLPRSPDEASSPDDCTYQSTPTQPEDPNFGLGGAYGLPMCVFPKTFPDPPPDWERRANWSLLGLG